MAGPTELDDNTDATAKRLEVVSALKKTPAVVAAVAATLAGDTHATDSLSGDERVAALMALMDDLDPDDLAKVSAALESRIDDIEVE